MEAGDNGIRRRFVEGWLSGGRDVRDDFFGMEPFVFRELVQPRDSRDENSIRVVEGGRELVLENRPPRGVRAGFEDRPDPRGSIFGTEPGKRFADRGGMVAEIIDDGDAANRAANFLSAFDAEEGGQRLADFRRRDSVKMRGGRGHSGIANIEITGHRNRELLTQQFE